MGGGGETSGSNPGRNILVALNWRSMDLATGAWRRGVIAVLGVLHAHRHAFTGLG